MKIIKKTKREAVHPYTPELKELGRLFRREFIRHVAVSGVVLGSIGAFLAGDINSAAASSDDPVRGGTLRT